MMAAGLDGDSVRLMKQIVREQTLAICRAVPPQTKSASKSMHKRSPFLVAFTGSPSGWLQLRAGLREARQARRRPGYTPEALAPQTSSAAGPGGAAQTLSRRRTFPANGGRCSTRRSSTR